MAKDDKYLLYGDDNRVEQQHLEDLAEETDDLLASNSRKKKKQKKPQKDDELNDLEDLDLSDIDDQLNSEDSEADDENPSSLDDNQEETESETQPEESSDGQSESQTKQEEQPEDKKKNMGPVIIVLVVVLALVLVMIAIMMGTHAKQAETTQTDTPQPTEEVTPTTDIATPTTQQAGTVNDGSVGFLTTVDRTHKYALGETLDMASTINSSALSYLNTVTAAVQKTANNDNVDLKSELGPKQAMLAIDIQTLKQYETPFMAYTGGTKYIASCEERFNNIKDMYTAALQSYSSPTDRINAVNSYIAKENQLAANSKASLKQYLDANHVDYSEDGDEIQYTYTVQP